MTAAEGTGQSHRGRSESAQRVYTGPLHAVMAYPHCLRWIRLVSNDTENIPMGLIAAWGSLFCAYSQPWHVGLLLAFTVARVGHTFAYANAKQPHRVFAYMVGVLATLGMCANGVAGALLA